MKGTCLKNVSRKHKSQLKSLALGIVYCIVFLGAEQAAQQALQSSPKIPQVIGVQQRIHG